MSGDAVRAPRPSRAGNAKGQHEPRNQSRSDGDALPEGAPVRRGEHADRSTGTRDVSAVSSVSPGGREAQARRYLIPWRPTAWARPRARVFNGRAQFFTSSKARTASTAIRTLLQGQQALLHPRPTPVSLWVNFLVQRPVRAPARVMWPTTRPDIDQYLKLLLDAGNGILWEDDSQVVQINMLKVFAPDGNPRIELSVSVALNMLVTMDPVGVWAMREGVASKHALG